VLVLPSSFIGGVVGTRGTGTGTGTIGGVVVLLLMVCMLPPPVLPDCCLLERVVRKSVAWKTRRSNVLLLLCEILRLRSRSISGCLADRCETFNIPAMMLMYVCMYLCMYVYMYVCMLPPVRDWVLLPGRCEAGNNC
jgi:hypothetical protein